MFYFPNVLNHRTGCFATIWLAATKGRKITRRDFLRVNVHRTCRDIMDYVLVRVPPLTPGLPRPRFSLYLSIQLQYGVILIYHRQCQLLLEDIQGAIDKLQRYSKRAQIDMLPEEVGLTHTIPDALTLLNESEGARDPFFGSMEFGLPSPSSLVELAEQMRELSPERPPSVRAVTPPSDGITASQESITMTEREPVVMPEPEYEGAELQEIDMIDILLEQPDHFLEGEEERGREDERVRQAEEERQRERDRERERRRERQKEREETVERERERKAVEIERMRELRGSIVSADQAPTTEVSRDVELVLEEDLGLPMEVPELAERERTPESEPLPIPPAPPTPEEERMLELAPIIPEPPVPPRRRRRWRRRRRRPFIDEVTQIPQEELQAQINDPQIETRALEDVLISLPSPRSDPAELLRTPCMNLPPPVMDIWEQGMVPRPRPLQLVRELELKSIPERELEREELGSREMPREMVESGVSQYDTPVSSVILETTDREGSPLVTPETRRSPPTLPVHSLEGIPEERVPELEQVMMGIEEPLRPAAEEEVTFHSLLPPVATRRTVAQAFWRLLERIDVKEVIVRQDVPFGDIVITPIQQN